MASKAKDVTSSPCECVGEGETVAAAARKLADMDVARELDEAKVGKTVEAISSS